jgi:hypothetical protein
MSGEIDRHTSDCVTSLIEVQYEIINKQRDEIERLRELLGKCVPYIEAYDPWDRELIDDIEKEVGDE